MQAAEARRRRLNYKHYLRVGDAQNFAKALGIETVDYAKRVDIANLANHTFFLAHEQGFSLPLAVCVRPFTEADDDPDEVAFYLPEFGDARGDIEINQDHPLWGEPTRLMREARQSQEFSTGDPRHPIAHELGELAMHQAIGGDRFFPFGEAYLAAEQQFQHEDLAHVYNVVSDRATVNHSEFVAEVFAALLLGREELRADKEIMRMYLEYGGDPGG